MISDVGSKDGTQFFSDRRAGCLPRVTARLLQVIFLHAAAIAPAFSALSPHTFAVLAASEASGSSFHGSLDLWTLDLLLTLFSATSPLLDSR